MQHISSHPLGCLTPSWWVCSPINFLPHADRHLLSIWLVMLMSLALIVPSSHSHRPLQGVQCPVLWSDDPVHPEGVMTSVIGARRGGWCHQGGGVLLILPPPVNNSLRFPLSFGKKTLLPVICNSHWHLPLQCSPAFLSGLNIIFRFNQMSSR